MAEKIEAKTPEKVQVNVRLDPVLHRAVGIRATLKGMVFSDMLNEIIEADCKKYPKLMKTIENLMEGVLE